jgi:hypothetical protein
LHSDGFHHPGIGHFMSVQGLAHNIAAGNVLLPTKIEPKSPDAKISGARLYGGRYGACMWRADTCWLAAL